MKQTFPDPYGRPTSRKVARKRVIEIEKEISEVDEISEVAATFALGLASLAFAFLLHYAA